MSDLINRILCRIGLHRWHNFNGVAREVGGRIVGASYDRRCLRCHKAETGKWMAL